MLKMYYSTLLKSFVDNEIPKEKRDKLLPVYQSILNKFLIFYGLLLNDKVGDEIYDEENLGLFFESLSSNYSKSSIPGMKSKLKKIREYAIKLGFNNKVHNLPFHETLEFALNKRNITKADLAKQIGVKVATVTSWASAKTLPSYQYLEIVNQIEIILEIPKGLLRSKMARVAKGQKGKLYAQRERTEIGLLTQHLRQYPYTIPESDLPRRVKSEIDDLITFYTTSYLSGVHTDLTRHDKHFWSIKANRCGKGELVTGDICDFLGFLSSPVDHPCEIQRGLGIPRDKLSMACLFNPDFIDKYIQFRMLRTKKLTTGVERILLDLKAFSQPEFGYIRQMSDVGKNFFLIKEDGNFEYPYQNISNESEWKNAWDQISDNTHRFLRKKISSSKFEPLVDDFKPVEDIIETDILGEIKEILLWIKNDANIKGQGPHDKAMKQRDYLLTLLLFLFELRIDHYSKMEFDKHLFKVNDGWKLRIFRDELKRPEILKNPHVTLDIPADVGKQIEEYKELYRSELYNAANSKKVFLGSRTGRKNAASLNGVQGPSLSHAFKVLMVLYSNSKTGFAAKHVKKIVSSVLDRKRDLSDFDDSATLALHTRRVSRESYTANQIQTAFNHYVHRLQRAGVLKMPSGERRKIMVDEQEYKNLIFKVKEQEEQIIELKTLTSFNN